MKVRILFAITALVPLYIGGLVGMMISLASFYLLPQVYARIFDMAIFLIALIIFVRSCIRLISSNTVIHQASGVLDSRLLVLYGLIFSIGATTIIIVLFLSNINYYLK